MVNSPGFLMAAAAVPPPLKRVVSSYLPNLVTGMVPPLTGKPVESALTPTAFIRLQKYLLIGCEATVAGVVPALSRFDSVLPLTQSPSLLPTGSAALGLPLLSVSTQTAWPVLK